MAIRVTKQLVVSEDDFSFVVPENIWTFADMLYEISIPDRKVSQIKLIKLAYPHLSLREARMIMEAAIQTAVEE